MTQIQYVCGQNNKYPVPLQCLYSSIYMRSSCLIAYQLKIFQQTLLFDA